MTKRLFLAALLLCALSNRADDVRRRYLVATDNDWIAVEATDKEAAALAAKKGVRFVEPDVERFVSSMAAPSHLSSAQVAPWGVTDVRAPEMWFLTRGQGVRVGIIDTGYDFAHPDLKDAYRGGYDFVHNDSTPEEEATGDALGHGTRMAGAIAATDNGFGVVGVAPGVSLYALKVFPRTGGALSSNIIRAIDWAIAQRLDVLSCSFGSTTPTRLEEEAFERARKANIVVVAATGNDGPGVNYPAAYASVIGVGASDRSRKVAAFSNRGSEVDFVAPGVDLLGTTITGAGRVGTVTLDDSTVLSAHPFYDSKQGEAQGAAVECGSGETLTNFPIETTSNIAVVERDSGSILTKLWNVVAAQASGMILVNNQPDDKPMRAGAGGGALPVTLSISAQSASRMRQHGGPVLLDAYVTDYDAADGTSFSTPYVAAVAALVRALRPDLSVDGVIDILRVSARDLGDPGRDTTSGYGLVDAYAAAFAAVPDRFPPPAKSRVAPEKWRR